MPPETKKPFKPDLTFADKLVGAGLGLYGRNVNRENLPLNKRIFLESVVDARKDPITSASFRPSELQALSDLIKDKYKSIDVPLKAYERYIADRLKKHNEAVSANNKDKMMYPEFVRRYKMDLDAIRQYKKGVLTPEFIELTSGKLIPNERLAAFTDLNLGLGFNVRPRIGYEDYGVEKEKALSVGGQSPRSALYSTLGQFVFRVDPKTKALVIEEDYDFNPIENAPSTEKLLATSPEYGTDDLYNAIRIYAGKVMPPGQGRKISLQLNQLAPPVKNELLNR